MKKGYFLVFLTAIISGFSIFVNQFGVNVINPYIFTWTKNLVVVFILTGLFFLLKDWKKFRNLNKKQWFLLIITGLIGGSIPFLLFFKGLSLTTAAKGSFIHKTMFIYVAFLATLILKEKNDKKFFIGGLFLLLGNAILLKKIPSVLNKGDLLIFIATLLWASENTISKYLLRKIDPRIVAWARMFFGSVFILLFLLTTNQTQFITTLNAKQIFWVIITAILLFGYVITWYTGLKDIPVSQATAILLLGSPVTTFLSLIVDGKLNYQEVISGFLIILGVIFVIGLKEIWQLAKEIKKLVYVRA